ncbi:hypothetical protein [Natronobiforma cellulositropha]|uniref:hypothetical protein n=1 Tax=Natronobiforma cellulositropha TaxID=1679076 RepID=UPI0021D58C79|nr:hypothetical protein [Natronobiforma cellulositropha]
MVRPLLALENRTVALALCVVALAGVAGAIAGFVLPDIIGTTEPTVAAITFELSPLMGALYGIVATATFLVTLAAVLVAVSALEDETLEP